MIPVPRIATYNACSVLSVAILQSTGLIPRHRHQHIGLHRPPWIGIARVSVGVVECGLYWSHEILLQSKWWKNFICVYTTGRNLVGCIRPPYHIGVSTVSLPASTLVSTFKWTLLWFTRNQTWWNPFHNVWVTLTVWSKLKLLLCQPCSRAVNWRLWDVDRYPIGL